MSVPNQKVITIHQSTEVPFVKLGINEYQEAFRKMAPCTFAMYLYLAGNMEGFKLELSKAAFENATGYTKSSYHRAYKDLVNLGYIYEDNGSLNFATSPKIGTKGVIQDWDSEVPEMNTPIFKNETDEFQNWDETYSEMNTEIDTKENKEEQIIDKEDLSYLKDIIKSNGQYIGGEKKGQWLEDDVPNLWLLKKNKDFRLGREIYKNSGFNLYEAIYIANNILSWNSRVYTFREGEL